VFAFLQQAGTIADDEMLRTFNCGIGFVVAVPPGAVDMALTSLAASGESASVIGEIVAADAVVSGPGQMKVVGQGKSAG
jgi:phosphoribosylformylglycinamidine cyclo-ligase